MLYRIKSYMNRKTALGFLALLGLAGVAYLYVSASGAQDESAALEAQRVSAIAEFETQKSRTAAATRDLTQERQQLAAKQERLESDRLTASIANLTTTQEAKSLRNRVINYVIENNLEIIDFQSADTVTVITAEETLTFIDDDAPNVRRIVETCLRTESEDPAGDQQLATVTYTLKTRGGRDAQIGLVGLAGDTRTTRVETLEIVREDDDSDVWNMKMCMHVPYGEE